MITFVDTNILLTERLYMSPCRFADSLECRFR